MSRKFWNAESNNQQYDIKKMSLNRAYIARKFYAEVSHKIPYARRLL